MVQIALVVVVAEHRDDRHADVAQLAHEGAGLRDRADAREVTAHEEHVGFVAQLLVMRRQLPRGVLADVDVGDRGDPYHRCSTSPVSCIRGMVTSLCSSWAGSISLTIVEIASRRSSVATEPVTNTL